MRLLTPIFLIFTCFTLPAQAGVYLTFTRPTNTGPSARVQAAVEARKQVNAAQAEFSRAYAQVILNHPMEWELKMARTQLVKAQARHAEAQLAAKQTLRATPEYRRLSIQILTLEEQLRGEKEIDKRRDLAVRLLDARSQRSAFESETFSSDSSVSTALAAMQQALADLRNVEQMYQWHIIQNETFAAARSRLDAARQQLANVGS